MISISLDQGSPNEGGSSPEGCLVLSKVLLEKSTVHLCSLSIAAFFYEGRVEQQQQQQQRPCSPKLKLFPLWPFIEKMIFLPHHLLMWVWFLMIIGTLIMRAF